jgi:hypothetical protein
MSSNRIMFHRTGFLLISGFFAAVGGWGQIVLPGQQVPGQSPGQYPGQSPYPGGSSNRYPGGRTSTTTQQNNQAPLNTLNGMLRRVEAGNSMVIEADDKRVVSILLARTTKYIKASGRDAKLSDLQPGDHVSIEATQDDNDYYHAVRVTQTSLATPEERSAASQPADISPIAPGGNAGNSGGSDSDDDRPRLHRAADNSTSADSRSADSNAPAAPDPGDPGPPVLRRGAVRRASDSGTPEQIADSKAPASSSPLPRPSIHAEDVNGVTRPPEPPRVDATAAHRAPMPGSGDPVIDMARDAAFSFSETLPNYVVKQFTTRYEAQAVRGRETSWRAVDTVTADVVSENGKESYKNLLIDGKPPKGNIEQTGTWSTGEYSSLLLDILHPATDADFHGKRSTTIVSRSAYRYDFSVEQENSHWHIYSGAESYKPEYTGSIWIDKENYRVLRIELSARNVPKGFPLDTVESAVDYDYVMISSNKYLLPVHSEALSCDRGTTVCSRNVIEFRNYRKFGADTSITFDAPQ